MRVKLRRDRLLVNLLVCRSRLPSAASEHGRRRCTVNIGFIGLGAMGRPMALNLLRSGHDLGVYARNPDAAAPIIAAGATGYATPAALAAASDAVIAMVTATSDVEEVLLGPAGVIEGARPGTIAIVMSTISPAATRRIAAALGARDIQMLDAPVTGGPMAAENATLTIMVGGEPDVLERARPILSSFGSTIVHVGGQGAGETAKACNQLALLITAEGVAEALALARRCGLDPRIVRQVLLTGIASSRVLEFFGGRMVDRQFEPGIEARLYHKDLGIVLDVARDAGQPLPAAAVVMDHLRTMMSRNQGNKDLSVLIELLENY
jgi:2-hydroxy-3-oxopropionate reductase